MTRRAKFNLDFYLRNDKRILALVCDLRVSLASEYVIITLHLADAYLYL